MQAALRERFALDDDEAARLAEQTPRDATDLFAFTSHIDERSSPPQRLRMVALMWRVACADGHRAAPERRVLWRSVDRLHVPHSASMQARQAAQREAGPA